jgi:hypothetical protein
MSYYAMWTGLGVTFKTADTSPRVIFWGRYLGHLIAMPVCTCKQISNFLRGFVHPNVLIMRLSLAAAQARRKHPALLATWGGVVV